MADIKIDTQKIKQGVKYITVDKPGIKKLKDSSIVFKNQLDDSPEARLTFYKMDDKGGTAITDFCQGQTQSYFVVPGTGNGQATCILTKPEGDFAYSISTFPATHETLDPIIIIEPSAQQHMTKSTGGKNTIITSSIVGFFIGAAITYVLLKTVFAKNN